MEYKFLNAYRPIYEKRGQLPHSYIMTQKSELNQDRDWCDHQSPMYHQETSSVAASSKHSSIDLSRVECQSATSWSRSTTPNYSIRPNGSSLTCLTMLPVKSANQNNKNLAKIQSLKLLKKKFFGHGPSARRCTKMLGQISDPISIKVPSWVRASCEDQLNSKFNETNL